MIAPAGGDVKAALAEAADHPQVTPSRREIQSSTIPG